MRVQSRNPFGAALLVLTVVMILTARAAAQELPRLRTDRGPISTATVEGGMSVIELLESIGRDLDIDVVFDPRMRDSLVAVSLRDAGPEEALDRVAAAAGLMWVALDERTVLFAEDNPQMRRLHEPQVVQTFYLEHADLRAVMTLLRSTMGAKSLSADERLNAVTVRDTAARVALARRLIERHDRALAVLEVDVLLVRLSVSAWESVRDALGGGTLPTRLDAEEAGTLEAAGRVEARPTLSFADGTEARLQLGPRNADPAAFDLTLTGRVAPSDVTITLEARIEGDSAGEERRRLRSTQRLEAGETWAVSGLLRADHEQAGETGHRVVLLTPRIASPASVRAADREPLTAGTEAKLGVASTDD